VGNSPPKQETPRHPMSPFRQQRPPPLPALPPDYANARPLYDVLIRANPQALMWGTDWPHPSIAADVMPDDGHLLDLFHDWTPDEKTRRQILVETPARLFAT
jgi:predicted TIM-barrel fold metal-dependent hydrolase